jgi:hypothetical protein
MTRAQFARYMDVHKAQVTRWVARGMPVLPSGGIDPEVGERWVRRNIDGTRRAMVQGRVVLPPKPRPPAPPGVGHLMDNVVDSAIATVLPMLACRLPAAATAVAVEHGMLREDAELLYRAVAVAAMAEVTGLLDSLSVPCPPGAKSWAQASIWDVGHFRPVD